jgi:hypothetical protein
MLVEPSYIEQTLPQSMHVWMNLNFIAYIANQCCWWSSHYIFNHAMTKWYVSNVSIIFDAPCLFIHHLLFLFCYTSWHFYAFTRTNLLTRCHSVSSYFLLFLCFRKVTQEIFSELDETKAKVPIFPDTRRSPKQRRRGARGQGPGAP